MTSATRTTPRWSRSAYSTDSNPRFDLDGHQVFATVSIGIALSSSGNTPEDLLRNADTAMYHAKANGKARFAVFDEGMRERAVARLEIETGLRKAIDAQQLVLHYQPELSVSSQQVKGYEALVRWNHPELRHPSTRASSSRSPKKAI